MIRSGLISLVYLSFLCLTPLAMAACDKDDVRGTGDLGVIVERATGSVLIVEHSEGSVLCRVEGFGDLSHASVVYSRDARFAFIFGRDGGLTRLDILSGKITHRIIQGGNSIGGAISQDGKLVAVSNYSPGGVRIFTTDNLTQVADIPATPNGLPLGSQVKASKTVGLVDAPGQKFVFSLFDFGEIWQVEMKDTSKPKITRFRDIGKQPYDGLISSNGRYYIAGLFGESGLALLDLWKPEKGVKRILPNYGKGLEKRPVYKMPHLEGWALTDESAFLPGVGQHEVLVVDRNTWEMKKTIPVKSQPVFAMVSPDERYVWVNFAFPDNQWIQVIDTLSMTVIDTLDVGKGVLHMEFTPRADSVWVSVRDEDSIKVFDVGSRKLMRSISAIKPSGIFFTNRSGRVGL